MRKIPNKLALQSHSVHLWVGGVLAWEKSCRPSMVIMTLAAVPTKHSQQREAFPANAVEKLRKTAVCQHSSVPNDV